MWLFCSFEDKAMIITDSDYEGSAIEELGSLFKVTQVFLWLVLTHSLTLIFSLFLLLCNLKTRFYFLTPFCFCRDYGIQVSSSVEQSVRLFFLSFYVHFFFFFCFLLKRLSVLEFWCVLEIGWQSRFWPRSWQVLLTLGVVFLCLVGFIY